MMYMYVCNCGNHINTVSLATCNCALTLVVHCTYTHTLEMVNIIIKIVDFTCSQHSQPDQLYDPQHASNVHVHIYMYTTHTCLLYTSPSPRDATLSRMPSSA